MGCRRIFAAILILTWTVSLPSPISDDRGSLTDEERATGRVSCESEPALKVFRGEVVERPDEPLCFEAYISNFDTRPLRDGEGPHFRGIPRWVVQHVDRIEPTHTFGESRERPGRWFTIPELLARGIAPTDDSYRFSLEWREAHPNWYERGHLAQKYLAERLSVDRSRPERSPAWFTHNVANAVPQRARFNKGPWLTLECYTGAWANRYEELWIISGPLFLGEHEHSWLRTDIERKKGQQPMAVAIPDALFKIVVREENDDNALFPGHTRWYVLAFIYLQDDETYDRRPWNPATHLDSVAHIEELTHETFLGGLPFEQRGIKTERPDKLWPVRRTDFDPSCRRLAPREQ